MALAEKMSNGRPTKRKQLQIQSTLREYYERGVSASFTSNKTRINIKTVCNYFNEWTNKLKHIETTSFAIRENREKERCLITMEYLIEKFYALLDQIADEIKNYKKEKKPVPKHLISSELQTLSKICDLTQQRRDLAVKSTQSIRRSEHGGPFVDPFQNFDDVPSESVKYY